MAKAAELGRDAGKTTAGQAFDGSTPEAAYRRVLHRIVEGGRPCRAASACADAFACSFWAEVERAAREHAS